MKFQTTPYHYDLIKDCERLSVFFEAINDYTGKSNLAFDLGCGSGVLSYFLASKFREVIAVEIDKKVSECAKANLDNFRNVKVINSDVLECKFENKADLILCEMMDTALIDEEEVTVLNHARRFLNDDGKIIPSGVINFAQLVNLKRNYIHWDEYGDCEVISNSIVYDEIDFLKSIDPNFEDVLSFKSIKNARINGIKLTTITKIDENIICGPTPMFNPPLLIPLEEKYVKCNDLINVKLKYIMGHGIESIESDYC